MFLITLFIVDILLLTNLSLKQLGTNVYGKINNKISLRQQSDERDKRRSKAKAFVGETIELNSKDRKNVDLEPLKDAFEKQDQGEDQLDVEDIRIIEYDKSNDEEKGKEANKVASVSTPDKDNQEAISLQVPESKSEAIDYSFPPIKLLNKPSSPKESKLRGDKVRDKAKLLEETLMSFGISAKVLQISRDQL